MRVSDTRHQVGLVLDSWWVLRLNLRSGCHFFSLLLGHLVSSYKSVWVTVFVYSLDVVQPIFSFVLLSSNVSSVAGLSSYFIQYNWELTHIVISCCEDPVWDLVHSAFRGVSHGRPMTLR